MKRLRLEAGGWILPVAQRKLENVWTRAFAVGEKREV